MHCKFIKKSSCQICCLNLLGDGANAVQKTKSICHKCLPIYLYIRTLNLAFTTHKIVAMYPKKHE
ncbi:hypothetical protein CSUNSWCD_2096 [Campylobacter showae CSUNSWCD]|uniref:Uncharacterized protein n=1 Tax=Campylobacter showae CSUNSWCD TaxID=1244083 RepID=M5IKC4_9BACT|nr:hypothetical protein CSUNSWCD_2096 [Campylobacter showae CSUNSWCD]